MSEQPKGNANALSPEEVKWGANISKWSFRDFLAQHIARFDRVPRDFIAGTKPGNLDIAGVDVGALPLMVPQLVKSLKKTALRPL